MKNKFFWTVLFVLVLTGLLTTLYLISMWGPRLASYPDIARYFASVDTKKSLIYDLKKDSKFLAKGFEAKKAVYDVEVKIPVLVGFKDNKVQETVNSAVKGLVTEQLNYFTSNFERKSDADLKTRASFSGKDEDRAGAKPFTTFVFNAGFQPQLLSDRFYSVRLDFYRYEGGAHGLSNCEVFNYDLGKGTRLRLGQLFSEGSEYLGLISTYVRKELKKTSDASWDINTPTAPLEKNFANFALTKDALVIYFDPYVVNVGAAGIVSVKIPWNELKTVLREDVLKL